MMTRGPSYRRRRRQRSASPTGRATSRTTRRRLLNARAYHAQAQSRLRAFRRSSGLAVGLTALLLLVWGTPAASWQRGDTADAAESFEQATVTLRDIFASFYALLPKILLSFVILALAALGARLVRAALRRTLGHWERADAIGALATISLYLAAVAISLSVLAGDVGALLGSVGLIGLALSWALQTPIESFTGWLLNSLRTYYRVGDRIQVGEVFGDVYKIDVLTTTVWEAGGPNKPVSGAQPTGAMITFPNWEVLRSNIVNYSREFPFVWDEVTIAIANESDLKYAVAVFEQVARDVVGTGMAGAAEQYQTLLDKARLTFDIDKDPSIFVEPADGWTNCTVRYLVGARQRRRRASDLVSALSAVTADPAPRGRIMPAYPRTEVRLRNEWGSQ